LRKKKLESPENDNGLFLVALFWFNACAAAISTLEVFFNMTASLA
jgi:hypothetical protein